MHLMRTTIELTDDQRSELVRLAAKRRMKGFSVIIQEAVDEYLRRQGGRDQAIAAALNLQGCLDNSTADGLEDRIRLIRKTWRCS